MLRKCVSLLLILCMSAGIGLYAQSARRDAKPRFEPNSPIGIGRGIYPGRVTFVRDPAVAKWDGHTGHWWDEASIDQEILNEMYDKSVCALAGTNSVSKAWKKIFEYHNLKVNGKKENYKPGQLIAIKINLNNTFEVNDRDNDIDQSAQGLIALLRQLAKAGVKQSDILIYDATESWRPRNIPDRIYTPVHNAFPDVRWMSCNGSRGVEKAHWQENAITYTSRNVRLGTALPKAVVEARYMINCGLLKGHEITGLTICAKNHFGSIRYPHMQHNTPTVNQRRGKIGDYSALVDLMGCPNLGKKTVLYIADGVYGMQTNVGAPDPRRDKWHIFDNQWSACCLMSLDPVALESVCLDFLYAEFGNALGFSGAPAFPKGSSINCDNYLREAARGRNDKLGEYRPNGKPTGSLGVMEHWNNPVDRQYSRNLGKKEGIELVTINIAE